MSTDAIAVVEHAYRLELSAADWLCGLAEHARADLDQGGGTWAMFHDTTNVERPRILDVQSAGALEDQSVLLPRLLERGGRFLGSTLRFSGIALVTRVLRDTFGDELGLRVVEELQQALDGPPSDLLQVGASEPGGVGLLIGAPCSRGSVIDRRVARRWSRIAGHLHSALRLRLALSETAPIDSARAEAILAPSGRPLHATEPAQAALEVLRVAAVTMDRARTARSEADEGIELWPAMVAGRWSIVEQFDSDGRRYLVALENEPDCPDPRALTERERQVVHFAAIGCSDKSIAYTLGLAPSRVGSYLSSARRKLGVRSRVELVTLVRMLLAAS